MSPPASRPRAATAAAEAGIGLRAEVLAGLRATPKRLASRWFYDARGSQLFEEICVQPEYYLTRTELQIFETHGSEIAEALGREVLLIEYGAGSAQKTSALLAAMPAPAGYISVEISAAALADSTQRLRARFPALAIKTCCADFTQFDGDHRDWPPHRRRAVFFPGSTLGNFDPPEALQLLGRMRQVVGEGGAVLLGLDLRKDIATVEAAYNDAAGVTRAFTLNMLARFNRELGADFDLDAFAHRARYDPQAHRIDTHIVSCRTQRVRLGEAVIDFGAGEAMLVERSYKYAVTPFAHFASQAGLALRQLWTDREHRFAVLLLHGVRRGAA